MQDQELSAEGERALDFSVKGNDAFFAYFLGLAANVDEVTGMDHQRANVELGAKFFHPRGLLGVDFGGAPHARAGGKYLESVGANLRGALDSVGCAAGGA